MQAYLRSSDIIDWHHPAVLEQARQLAWTQRLEMTPPTSRQWVATQRKPKQGQVLTVAKACFEWVRDRIQHSVDYQRNPVTCRASEVLQHQTGYCFAKSHLLAALLRANGIPAGFCYQRLSVDDQGAPYTLHGFNAVYLAEFGWYRLDPRGNKPGIDAQFTPPREQLAFEPQLPEEADFRDVLAEPLPIVIEALQRGCSWDELLPNLPDLAAQDWESAIATYEKVSL